jgi:hypothetical protein
MGSLFIVVPRHCNSCHDGGYAHFFRKRLPDHQQFSGFLVVIRTDLMSSHFSVNSQMNPLTEELNPSAQRCLASFFTGDFAS